MPVVASAGRFSAGGRLIKPVPEVGVSVVSPSSLLDASAAEFEAVLGRLRSTRKLSLVRECLAGREDSGVSTSLESWVLEPSLRFARTRSLALARA